LRKEKNVEKKLKPPVNSEALRVFENDLWYANPEVYEYVNDDEFGFFEDVQLSPNYCDTVIPQLLRHEKYFILSIIL